MNNDNQGGMAYPACPTIWPALDVTQKSHVLTHIVHGMGSIAAMKENAYYASAMLWPQLGEQERNLVWNAAYHYLRTFLTSLSDTMSCRYPIDIKQKETTAQFSR